MSEVLVMVSSGLQPELEPAAPAWSPPELCLESSREACFLSSTLDPHYPFGEAQ